MRTPHPRLVLFGLALSMSACAGKTATRAPDSPATSPGTANAANTAAATTADAAAGTHAAAPSQTSQTPGALAAPQAQKPSIATPIADAYRDAAGRIIEAALADPGAYDKLAYLTDRIGHRLSGSKGLERAVDWAVRTMIQEGHDNVRAEPVMVPHWVRGKESAEILSPISTPLHILGIGNTVGTGPRGVTAELVVVDSFEQLDALGAALKGKIVLFDRPMPAFHPDTGSGYGELSAYRVGGPSRAARLGARAVLVRSLTAHSLRTPHTGTLYYEDDAPRIPAAAVTTEDADLLARLAASGDPVKVRLTLGARMLPDARSANVVAELPGRERPDEIVLIGCHLDSWDVGQGAHDDGAGCVMMMQTLTLLRRLDLQPRRTIRVVLFTNEENGLRGARAYAEEHAAELPRHVMALESDSGGFAPQGFRVQGNEQALAQMQDIASLLAPIDATRATAGYSGADIMPLARAGVPSLGLQVDGATYFDYHHTHADTLDKVDPQDLARDLAAVAVVAYVIADMPEPLGGARDSAPAAAQPDAH